MFGKTAPEVAGGNYGNAEKRHLYKRISAAILRAKAAGAIAEDLGIAALPNIPEDADADCGTEAGLRKETSPVAM